MISVRIGNGVERGSETEGSSGFIPESPLVCSFLLTPFVGVTSFSPSATIFFSVTVLRLRLGSSSSVLLRRMAGGTSGSGRSLLMRISFCDSVLRISWLLLRRRGADSAFSRPAAKVRGSPKRTLMKVYVCGSFRRSRLVLSSPRQLGQDFLTFERMYFSMQSLQKRWEHRR
jgi:hypothetical protein